MSVGMCKHLRLYNAPTQVHAHNVCVHVPGTCTHAHMCACVCAGAQCMRACVMCLRMCLRMCLLGHSQRRNELAPGPDATSTFVRTGLQYESRKAKLHMLSWRWETWVLNRWCSTRWILANVCVCVRACVIAYALRTMRGCMRVRVHARISCYKCVQCSACMHV